MSFEKPLSLTFILSGLAVLAGCSDGGASKDETRQFLAQYLPNCVFHWADKRGDLTLLTDVSTAIALDSSEQQLVVTMTGSGIDHDKGILTTSTATMAARTAELQYPIEIYNNSGYKSYKIECSDRTAGCWSYNTKQDGASPDPTGIVGIDNAEISDVSVPDEDYVFPSYTNFSASGKLLVTGYIPLCDRPDLDRLGKAIDRLIYLGGGKKVAF